MIFNVENKVGGPTEALPLISHPGNHAFSMSITEGLSFGFIILDLLKLVTGRSRETTGVFHLVSRCIYCEIYILENIIGIFLDFDVKF